MRILFTSDLHGRIEFYEQLWQVAPEYDHVILGGDLLPNPHGLSVDVQRRFLEQALEQIRSFHCQHPDTRFHALLGNDDWGCHQELLDACEHVDAISGRVISLSDEWSLLGYGYVNPTPFGMKDWERWDCRVREAGRFSLEGYRSRNGQAYRTTLSEGSPETIAKDLERLALQVPCFRHTVCVMHAPPYRTPLDWIYSGAHVGSRAIRAFIEKHQPALTLHGHIHESPNRSGEWFTRIGKTISINPGQSRHWHYVSIELGPLALQHSAYGRADLTSD